MAQQASVHPSFLRWTHKSTVFACVSEVLEQEGYRRRVLVASPNLLFVCDEDGVVQRLVKLQHISELLLHSDNDLVIRMQPPHDSLRVRYLTDDRNLVPSNELPEVLSKLVKEGGGSISLRLLNGDAGDHSPEPRQDSHAPQALSARAASPVAPQTAVKPGEVGTPQTKDVSPTRLDTHPLTGPHQQQHPPVPHQPSPVYTSPAFYSSGVTSPGSVPPLAHHHYQHQYGASGVAAQLGYGESASVLTAPETYLEWLADQRKEGQKLGIELSKAMRDFAGAAEKGGGLALPGTVPRSATEGQAPASFPFAAGYAGPGGGGFRQAAAAPNRSFTVPAITLLESVPRSSDASSTEPPTIYGGRSNAERNPAQDNKVQGVWHAFVARLKAKGIVPADIAKSTADAVLPLLRELGFNALDSAIVQSEWARRFRPSQGGGHGPEGWGGSRPPAHPQSGGRRKGDSASSSPSPSPVRGSLVSRSGESPMPSGAASVEHFSFLNSRSGSAVTNRGSINAQQATLALAELLPDTSHHVVACAAVPAKQPLSHRFPTPDASAVLLWVKPPTPNPVATPADLLSFGPAGTAIYSLPKPSDASTLGGPGEHTLVLCEARLGRPLPLTAPDPAFTSDTLAREAFDTVRLQFPLLPGTGRVPDECFAIHDPAKVTLLFSVTVAVHGRGGPNPQDRGTGVLEQRAMKMASLRGELDALVAGVEGNAEKQRAVLREYVKHLHNEVDQRRADAEKEVLERAREAVMELLSVRGIAASYEQRVALALQQLRDALQRADQKMVSSAASHLSDLLATAEEHLKTPLINLPLVHASPLPDDFLFLTNTPLNTTDLLRAPSAPFQSNHRDLQLVPQHDFDDNGLFHHLRATYGGLSFTNPVLLNLVEIHCSSPPHPRSARDASCLVGQERGHFFLTSDCEGGWLEIELKAHVLKPSAYTLQHGVRGSDAYALRHWVFEASLDRDLWVELASHDNDTHLGVATSSHTWPLAGDAYAGGYFN
eukprot:gene20430-31449_t